MNHPTHNEWLAYLDGEVSDVQAERLFAHLIQCPACAAEVAGWERSVQKLQRLSFPPARQLQPGWQSEPAWASTVVKWGMAAAIVLLLGFAFGRWSAARAEASERTLAAQIHEQLRHDLREDLLAALDPEKEAKDGFQKQLRFQVENALAKTTLVAQRQRQQDQQRLLVLIKDLHDQQIADYVALRQDLETAVSTADSDLRQDSRRINQLADSLLTVQKH